MRFLAPTGIGDVTWALTKAKAIATRLGDGVVDMHLACHKMNAVETRALEYVQRFPFVNSCRMIECGPVLKPDGVTDSEGYYNYFDDGPCNVEGTFALMPNRHLEHGRRLETWFPDDPTDWTITREWANTAQESAWAAEVRSGIGPFAILYFGPETGNTAEGHNRGALWTPTQWVQIALRLRDMGLKLVAVGATYDDTYYRKFILPAVRAVDPALGLMFNFVGALALGQTLALIRASTLGIYYQCGLGVWSCYEGKPTAMFWRPEGDSISSERFVRISGDMKTAWVPPIELESGHYLPAAYTRTGADEITAWAEKATRSGE